MNDKKHPTIFNPLTISLIIFTAVFGAIIGIQLITTLGISANTSIIGAIFAMIIARVTIKQFISFKSIHRQNIVLTSISAATFGAGSTLILPIGIPFAMGMPELILVLLLGVTL